MENTSKLIAFSIDNTLLSFYFQFQSCYIVSYIIHIHIIHIDKNLKDIILAKHHIMHCHNKLNFYTDLF